MHPAEGTPRWRARSDHPAVRLCPPAARQEGGAMTDLSYGEEPTAKARGPVLGHASRPTPATSDGREVLSALGELEVAHEELRVAEDELSRNRAQLQELVSQYESGQRWREHLFALLPVGVLVTDDMGTVKETNGAAAALLGVRPALLVRKPLPVYVDAPHRRLVRVLIAQLARGEPELR